MYGLTYYGAASLGDLVTELGYGTTNAAAGVGIGMKRGDPNILTKKNK